MCTIVNSALFFNDISIPFIYCCTCIYISLCICIYHIFASTSIYQTCGVPRSVPTRDHGRPCDVSAWRGAHLTKPWGVQFVKTSTLWCWFMSSCTWPGPVLIHQKWSTCYAETENPWFEEFEGFLIGRRLCTATTALVRGLFSSRDLQRLIEPQAAALQRGSSRVEVWNQTASNSIQMVPWTSRLRFTCCWNSFPMLPMCLCQEIWRWNRVIFSGPWSICSEKSLGLLPYLVD